MRGSNAGGKKPIEEVKKLRARVAKLERLRSKSTEHTNSNGQLDEAWHEWEMTFDATKDSIMLIDSEFKIIQANRATSHFLDMPLEEIVGKTCWQVLHGTEAPPEKCPFKKELKRGKCESCNKIRLLDKCHVIKKAKFTKPYSKWIFLKFHPANVLFLCKDCHP